MAERKKTGHCTANTPDGKQCPCKAYDDPDNPPHGIPVVCRECCHGKSNHDGSPPTGVRGVFKNLLDKDGEAYQKARLETNSNLKKVEAESKVWICNGLRNIENSLHLFLDNQKVERRTEKVYNG